MGGGPEDVESLHAAAFDEVPLTQGFVGGAGDEGGFVEVEGCYFGDVGGEGS